METTFNIELRDINSITPYENNPRINDGAVDLSPEQVKAYRLADNKTNELAEWDFEILPIELSELRDMGFDMSVLAFDEKELAKLLSAPVQTGNVDPDHIPEPPDEPITQKGDLWILGDHRLLCGDSANPDDVDYLLDDNVIHLTNTDPPYGVRVEPRSNNAIAAGLSSFSATHHQSFDAARHDGSLEPTSKKLRPKDRPLENDFLSDEEFDQKLDAWFGNIARVLLPGRAAYVWGGYANLANYPPMLKKHGLYFSQCIVWDKLHPVLTRKDFMGSFEICFYCWREGAAHQFYGPNNATDLWLLNKAVDGKCGIGSGVRLNFPDGSRLDVMPPSDKNKIREVEVPDDELTLVGLNPLSDVWRTKKINPQSMIHLTEKPCSLAVRAIEYSSLPGENVLELFCGSGSTLIACEMTGRKCFAMEIDRWYCDVIVKRYEEFTGRKVKRISAESRKNMKRPSSKPATVASDESSK